MGLTIHYELNFGGSTEEALRLVKLMREKAMDMAFEEVSEVKRFIGKDCEFSNHRHNGQEHNEDDDWVWALIQAQGKSVVVAPDGRQLEKGESSFVGCCHINPRPIEVIVFRTWAGYGCEEANFGLARYEKSIMYNGKRITTRQGNGWRWHSFCKTQYANEKGIMNFLRCHTLVVSMLDYAKGLGILKEVHDEGKYWEKRNLKELTLEVGEWDKLVAGLSGMLTTQFGEGVVESAISNNPEYEKLKEIGTQHLAKNTFTKEG